MRKRLILGEDEEEEQSSKHILRRESSLRETRMLSQPQNESRKQHHKKNIKLNYINYYINKKK